MNPKFQRRSAISKTALIGNSQIPSTLGQTITGALANIPFPFGIDATTGDYGYYKAGADTVTPFRSGYKYICVVQSNYNSGTTMIWYYNDSWDGASVSRDRWVTCGAYIQVQCASSTYTTVIKALSSFTATMYYSQGSATTQSYSNGDIVRASHSYTRSPTIILIA